MTHLLPPKSTVVGQHKGHTGFTLVEMAVAVFIIALLLGSMLVPLATQVEQRQISDTQKTLDEIKEALIGFAVTNGYLPCPDKTTGAGAGTANDGLEDVAAGACVVAGGDGNVPWATLGVANRDAWGNRFRYRVAANFAHHTTLFTLTSTSGLEVCSEATCTNRLTPSGDGPPAVILSHGRNGWGAVNVTGTSNPAPTSPDELANSDDNVTFVSRIPTAVGSTAGEFDDIVTWLSKFTLFNRMVAAGKLP